MNVCFPILRSSYLGYDTGLQSICYMCDDIVRPYLAKKVIFLGPIKAKSDKLVLLSKNPYN